MFKINKNFYLIPYVYAVARDNEAIREFRYQCMSRFKFDPFAAHIIAPNPRVNGKPINVYYAFEWLWFSVGLSL